VFAGKRRHGTAGQPLSAFLKRAINNVYMFHQLEAHPHVSCS
jgi:hypothetical protein